MADHKINLSGGIQPEGNAGVDEVQLIEPDGTLGMITTRSGAIKFCQSNPGWGWREIDK